jgi:outer membrane protein assembly factor BamB
MTKTLLLGILLSFFTITDCFGNSHYVYNKPAKGANGIQSVIVYPNIQAAIDDCNNGDEVVVYPGTYKGVGNKDLDFHGKAITVRSQDPNNPAIVESTIIDCEGNGRGFYFHSNENTNSILAGFTITGGCGNYQGGGGGIYCSESNPIIRNCVIRNNLSGMMDGGGGISCYKSSPKIEFCTISNNISQNWGGGIAYYGLEYYASPGPVISNCIITDNYAENIYYQYYEMGGGGIYSYGSGLIIQNCFICNNRSVGNGGGVCCIDIIKVSNSIVSCNTSEKDGAGIYMDGGEINGCTIVSNKSYRVVGGLYQRYDYGSGFWWSALNCIIWGNISSHPEVLLSQTNCFNAIYCCIQDEDPYDASIPYNDTGFGNIDDDPLFVREPDDGGDGFGDNPSTPDIDEGANDDLGDLHLMKNSPCINAGVPMYYTGNEDIDGQPRIIGGRVDIGADEYSKMIIVIKPTGREIWADNSSHNIEWSSYGAGDFVDVMLSIDNGSNWQITESDVPNSGNYIWTLPGAVDSNQCLIKVVPAVPDANVLCIPSRLFTIKPYNPDEPVNSIWKSLGNNYKRQGLSDFNGPELGCVKWAFDTNGPVTSSVAVGHDGRIYAACEDGNLYAIDPNGTLLWKYDANTPLKSSPSIGPDGTVYVGGENGWLYAIDKNGQSRWTYQTGGCIYSSPAVDSNGRIFVGSMDGKLYAIGPDGSELWQFKTAGYAGRTNGSIIASPAIDSNGVVYITGSFDPNLYALNANDGSVKWKIIAADFDPNILDLHNSSVSPVIGADGTIYWVLYEKFIPYPEEIPPWGYVTIEGYFLYAVEPDNGRLKWKSSLTGFENWWYFEAFPWLGPDSSPWISPEFTGSVKYSDSNSWFRFGKWYKSGCFSEPAIGPDGTIYISCDDPYLRAVDPNGKYKWTARLGMVGGFTMAVGADGLVYAACDDGYLCVVDGNGTELSRFISKDNIMSRPVIAENNQLIISDANNKIWAISGDNCPEGKQDLHRPADLSGDGIVNFKDFAIFAQNWSRTTNRYFGDAMEGDAGWYYKKNQKPPDINEAYYGGIETYFESDLDRNLYADSFDLFEFINNWFSKENPENRPPKITITNPKDESWLFDYYYDFCRLPIIFEADADDTDGQVVKVEFFIDGLKVGEDVDGSDGWQFVLSDYYYRYYMTNGPQWACLSAKATDDKGAASLAAIQVCFHFYDDSL